MLHIAGGGGISVDSERLVKVKRRCLLAMGIASSPPRHERNELKVRDSGRKSAILKLKAEGKKHRAIASGANCSERYVREVIKVEQRRTDEAQKGQRQWFQNVSENELANIIVRIEAVRTEGRTNFTSDLADPDKIRLITKAELEANTFPHSWITESEKGKGVQWLRYHLSGSKASSQGFVIMKGDAFESAGDFVRILDKREYKTEFYRILQKIQSSVKSTGGVVASGDGKRWQATMRDVFNVAAQNVRDAQVLFEEENIDDDMKKDRMRFLQEKNSEFDVVSRMINHQLKIYDIIYQVSPTNHKALFDAVLIVRPAAMATPVQNAQRDCECGADLSDKTRGERRTRGCPL